MRTWLIGLSMLSNFENVSLSLMLFRHSPHGAHRYQVFHYLFYCLASFVWYDIHVIIGKRTLSRRFFLTLHRGCDGASFWEMWTSRSTRWSAEHGTTQVQWNPSLGSDQHLFGLHSPEDVFHREGYHHFSSIPGLFLVFLSFFLKKTSSFDWEINYYLPRHHPWQDS